MLYIPKHILVFSFLGFSICPEELHGEMQRLDSQGFQTQFHHLGGSSG